MTLHTQDIGEQIKKLNAHIQLLKDSPSFDKSEVDQIKLQLDEVNIQIKKMAYDQQYDLQEQWNNLARKISNSTIYKQKND